MKNNDLASFLTELLQTEQRNGATQIIINTEEANGVNWLTVENDGTEIMELMSKNININRKIKIEQNSITRRRKLLFPILCTETANLSLVVELPVKYSPIPIIFNGEKFGGVNYLVSEVMQEIIFNPSLQ